AAQKVNGETLKTRQHGRILSGPETEGATRALLERPCEGSDGHTSSKRAALCANSAGKTVHKCERETCGPLHSVAWRSVFSQETRTHGFASHPRGWFAFVVDTRTSTLHRYAACTGAYGQGFRARPL